MLFKTARLQFFKAGSAALLGCGLFLGMIRAAHAESYISLFMGHSQTRSSNLHVVVPSQGTDVTFHGVRWKEHSLSMPPYYGYKLGAFSEKHPHWGGEFEITHFKVYAQVNDPVQVTGTWKGVPVNTTEVLGNKVQRFDLSHGVNTVGFHLLYRWTGKPTESFPHGRFQPFVGGGPAYYFTHPENTIDGQANEQEYTPDRFGWQAFGGVRYGLSHKVTLFSEARYSSGSAEVKIANGGWASTKIHTWHGQFGVEYGF